VYLCHNPASSQGPARIEAYIETFGKEFAFVLYQWYIDQGQLHALLTQDEVYGSLLTAFFEAHPHPELSWMHDIACKRYGGAAAALVAVDGSVDDLAEKHVSRLGLSNVWTMVLTRRSSSAASASLPLWLR
jgi:nuclear pore complex protein Nup133